MKKELARDIVLLLIVTAGIVSFFFNPQGVDMKFLQMAMTAIIGYYTGMKNLPILSAIKK